jgi:uncharacterized protein (DUF2062 family)
MSLFSLKKYIPSAETIKNSKSLRFLGTRLEDPNLFHMNRRSVSLAFFWGILVGLLPPIPIHTPLAAAMALVFRCNLPLTVAIVWIGNPLTLPIIVTSFYWLGCLILNVEPISYFDFTWHGFLHQLSLTWKPYLVGAIIGDLAIATATYFAVSFFWRLNVKRKWRARKLAREK